MKYLRFAVLALALAAVLLAARLLYGSLSEKVAPNGAPGAPVSEAEAESKNTAVDFDLWNGEEASRLSDRYGKPVIVNFWATWCGPCKSELPAFQRAWETYGDEIEFIMVNLTDGTRDTVDGARAFAAENGYSFPLYFDVDGSGASAYAIRSIPMTVFITADGNELEREIGAMTEDRLQGFIDRLLQ